MQDVASAADVSRTTVSLVINEVADVRIPEQTRQRVWDAVAELGFRPNVLAQSLRSQKSNVIGLITDDIATTPFAVDIIKGAQQAAHEADLTLLIVDTDRDEDAIRDAFDRMAGWQVQGLIYATEYHYPVELPGRFHTIPTVLVDCFDPAGELPSVVPDEVQGGQLATETLIKNGHTRIGFVNGPEGFTASHGRLDGYQQALGAAGIEFDVDLIVTGDWWQEGGYAGAEQLMSLDKPPTAIFCANDWMAMGAYDALRDLGKSIPDDVSVIGFDNREIIAAHMRPPLTSIALPYAEMGRQGVELLLERINGTGEEAIRASVPCPLVVRSSTKANGN